MKVLPFLVVSLLVSLFFSYQHYQTRQQTYSLQQKKIVDATTIASKQLDVMLSEVITTADSLAAIITAMGHDKRTNLTVLDTYLANTLAANHNFHGSSITFKPFAFHQNTRLFARYLSIQDQKHVFSQIENDYDYTATGRTMSDWFTKPMAAAEQGNTDEIKQWNGPYWDDAGHTTMMTYSTPFYADNSKQQLIGLVTIDLSIAQIRQIILSMDLGISGYPTLTGNDSHFIHHPGKITEHTNGPQSFKQIAEHSKKPEYNHLVEEIKNKKAGILTDIINKEGDAAWIAYAPLPSTGWSLQSLFIIADIPVDMNQFRKQLYLLTACWVITLMLLLNVLLVNFRSVRLRVSIESAIVSIILFAGIAALWNYEIIYPDDPDRNNSLTSLYEVNAEVERYMAHQSKLNHKARFIPTGLEIETMGLNGDGALSLSGYLWLSYEHHQEEPLLFDEQSIQFSQAQSNSFTLIQHKQIPPDLNGIAHTYQLFRFEAVVDSNNDQSDYPLEFEHISLTLNPVTTMGNIYFIPDLVAYHNKTPTAKPGLNSELAISGWDITSTYFSFTPDTKSSTLGLTSTSEDNHFPDLSFNIVIKRNFIDAFISNLTPLIVVAIVLFSITLLTYQMTIAEMFGIAVSMFFVVVFSHLSIRSTIAVGEIFYLEYFFLVIYLAILTVPINHFRVTLKIPSRLLDYHNGLYFKALYWPVMLLIFFIITFVQFY